MVNKRAENEKRSLATSTRKTRRLMPQHGGVRSCDVFAGVYAVSLLHVKTHASVTSCFL